MTLLFPYLADDFVHGPTVELFVGQDLERDTVLVTVPFDSFEAVISISGDSLE